MENGGWSDDEDMATGEEEQRAAVAQMDRPAGGKKARQSGVRLHVPSELVVLMQNMEPQFGKAGRHGRTEAGFAAMLECLQNDGHDEMEALRLEIECLKLELDDSRLITIDGMRGDANAFEGVFGFAEVLFDMILSTVHSDLPDGTVNIFSPQSGGPSRKRAVGVPLEDILGLVMRRIRFKLQFKPLGTSLRKSDEWARMLFWGTVEAMVAPDSQFVKQYLTPPDPQEEWRWVKEKRPRIVDFLSTYVPDFDSDNLWLPIMIDGVHIEAQELHNFFLHLLTFSNKKGGNTTLSVVAGSASCRLLFASPLFGGRTSEKMIMVNSELLETILEYAQEYDAKIVFFVDKGFQCVVDFASQHEGVFTFIPVRKEGNHQLTKEESIRVREIAHIRQV